MWRSRPSAKFIVEPNAINGRQPRCLAATLEGECTASDGTLWRPALTLPYKCMKSAIPAVAFDTEMIVTYTPLYGPLIVVPLCIGIAWWFWARPEQLTAQKWGLGFYWRVFGQFGNVIIFYACLTYRLFVGLTPKARRIEDLCAGIGVSLSLAVLGAVIFGEGVSRIPLVFCRLSRDNDVGCP